MLTQAEVLGSDLSGTGQCLYEQSPLVTVPVPTGDTSTAASRGQQWGQGSNLTLQSGCNTALKVVRCEKRSSCTRLTLDAPDLSDGFVFAPLKALHWEQHTLHTHPEDAEGYDPSGMCTTTSFELFRLGGKSHIIKKK